jgi:ATPase subunit of ABC transporter with duplicated ATPase domains
MLAATLLEEPDILVLDEPTNHLDDDGRAWLVEFLNRSQEAVIFVSHDRAFIDAVADKTIELMRGGWFQSAGGYSDLIDAKRVRDDRQRADYAAHKSEVTRLKNVAEAQAQKAAQVTKAPKGQRERGRKPYFAAMQAKIDQRASAVRSRAQLEESRDIRKPYEAPPLQFHFPTSPLRSGFAVQGRGLTAYAGTRRLFERLNLDLEPGERIAIQGPNGSGKTTLLRGLLDPSRLDRGEVVWGVGARAEYLEQTFPYDDRSASEIVGAAGRSLLGSLGLHGEIQTRPANLLSMGERMRVELTRTLMEGANVLMLDEPTNHLDLPALEALENALLEFKGGVLFVSHDARFVERVADRVITLGDSR